MTPAKAYAGCRECLSRSALSEKLRDFRCLFVLRVRCDDLIQVS